MNKIYTVAHVPPELEKSWLQHLRNFDVAHPGCHFEVMLEGPDRSLPEIVEALTLDPELTFAAMWKRGRP